MNPTPILAPSTPTYTPHLPEDLWDLETTSPTETERLKVAFSRPSPSRGAYPFPRCWITVQPQKGGTCFTFDAYSENTPLTLQHITPYLNVLHALGWELRCITEWRIKNQTCQIPQGTHVFTGRLTRRHP